MLLEAGSGGLDMSGQRSRPRSQAGRLEGASWGPSAVLMVG